VLTTRAARLKPGQTGLLALDWHNGNRTILVDPLLSGAVIGLTLHTRPEEIYRALIEGTAFGARMIVERFEEYGVPVTEVVNCGGIAEKNPFLMQTYADILGRPMKVSRSSLTCALGAAIFGAVAAGAYARVEDAQAAMTGLKKRVYEPDPARNALYERLFALYRELHDVFGTTASARNLGHVMKELVALRKEATGA
jgi:L-ribulokinase